MQNKLSKRKIFDWIHHNFLATILLCYAAGAFFPGPGIFISKIHFGIIDTENSSLKLSVPFIMISLLLFNSALGIRQSELKSLKQHPAALIWGLVLNFFIPLLIILAVSLTMQWWHSARGAAKYSGWSGLNRGHANCCLFHSLDAKKEW